jgi:hypothetical protein
MDVRTEGCPDDELLIALDPQPSAMAELNGFLFPAVLDARISLGVSF